MIEISFLSSPERAISRAAALSTPEFRAPASPLSLVITIYKACSTGRTAESGCCVISCEPDMRLSTEAAARAYARPRRAVCCALRIFAADTASMAFVTVCDFFIATILVLICLRPAMGLCELFQLQFKLRFGLRRDIARPRDALSNLRRLRAQKVEELLLVLLHALHRHFCQIAVDSRVNDYCLLFERQRLAVFLAQDRHQARAGIDALFGVGVEVLRKLHKGLQLAELREFQLDSAGNFFHRLGLRAGTHARHREPRVDSRTHAFVKEVCLEEDLPVGNGYDVGRDVAGDVAFLRLDNRERGQRTAAFFLIQFCGALEQAAVQVKYVARIRLAARRAAQEERKLAVCHRVLGEVVINNERVAALVH